MIIFYNFLDENKNNLSAPLNSP